MEAQKVNREVRRGVPFVGSMFFFFFFFAEFYCVVCVLSTNERTRCEFLIPTVDSISCRGTWQSAHAYTSCGSRILAATSAPSLDPFSMRGATSHRSSKGCSNIADTTAPNFPHNHRPRRSNSAAWRGQLTPNPPASVRPPPQKDSLLRTASSQFPPSPR
jgi:hypothetical protein